MHLTDVKIRSATPADRLYKLYDTDGLFLFITPNGSKLWRLKYHYARKRHPALKVMN